MLHSLDKDETKGGKINILRSSRSRRQTAARYNLPRAGPRQDRNSAPRSSNRTATPELKYLNVLYSHEYAQSGSGNFTFSVLFRPIKLATVSL